ncbi:endolytic transglycosylase MltG [Niallia nealsonii]|uniref:Aminodeoxychorismate lyase n=1 Tax=Niallia nealsonii TaxID=115979 RepID=A0A2N0Z898_9BACI|nr:endolytic transglycosylase MltG [Niallia nealsonii]PKG25737.1 aminodeoxychorismate lyase [Niallia nealsonii]
MNKHKIRAFAFGIFFSISLIGVFYFLQDKEKNTTSDLEESKRVVMEKGYTILSKTDYEQLQTKIATLENQTALPSNETENIKTEAEKTSPSSYQLHIVKGMSTEEIAKKLANKNMIKNEKKFAQFLIQKGYHTKVQIGKYTIKKDMTYKQIAELITK